MQNICSFILWRKEHLRGIFEGHFLEVLQKKSTDFPRPSGKTPWRCFRMGKENSSSANNTAEETWILPAEKPEI